MSGDVTLYTGSFPISLCRRTGGAGAAKTGGGRGGVIGSEWTGLLSAAAAGLLFAALAAAAWPAAAPALRQLKKGKATAWALLLVCLAGAAALFLRPGEDTFTGLDVSAYRLMSRSLAEGRALQGTDRPLQGLPRHVRSLVLYRPEHHKTTRSQSFRIDSLDSCSYRPFYYPLLPLAAAGFDRIVPGEARDYLPGLAGLILAAVLLLVATAELGAVGGALVVFLMAGTAFPAWFFRGFFPEAVGTTLIGLSLLSWLGGPQESAGAPLGRSFALGLAFSFHPVLAVYAFPFLLLMICGSEKKGFGRGLAQVGSFIAGALPLYLQTRFVTAPYGSFSLGSLRNGMNASPAIRATILAAAGLLFLAILLFAARKPFTVWLERREQAPVAGRLVLALVWTLPTALALTAGGSETVRTGAVELLRGTGPFWLVPLLVFTLYAFMGPGLGRVRAAGAVVAASLPLFLFLKGLETGTLWSQRRLFPFVICLAVILFPAAVAALQGLRRRAGPGAALAAALILVACGLVNFVRWPAPYMVREERGAEEWVDRLAARFEGATVFFDYHPLSVPFAALGEGNIFGLGPYARDKLAKLAPFVYRRASEEDFFWVSAYGNPGLEGGVRLVSRGMEEASLPVIRGKTVFPAVEADKKFSVEVLEAIPLLPGERPPPAEKIMDRGPLGLRPPWGRADIPIRTEGGTSLPARWSRQGSGIVGPVPLPGEMVTVTVEGVSGRPEEEGEQVLLLEAPWEGGQLSFRLAAETRQIVERITRPAGGEPGKVRTGIYRFFAARPYDPAAEGIRGFNSDLGALLHRVRIELAPGREAREVR